MNDIDRYTDLANERRCPHIVALSRADARRNEAPVLQTGTLGHEFYKRYGRHCVDTKQQTDLSVADTLARQAWDGLRVGEYAGKAFLNAEQFEQAKRDVLDNFATTHIFHPDKIVDIERLVVLDRGLQPVTLDDPDAWFRGQLDLVEQIEPDVFRITDYKTGFNTTPDWFQADVYAWLCFLTYRGVEAIEFVFDYTRFNVQKGPRVYERNADLEPLTYEIIKRCKELEADTEMKPTPGAACDTCMYVCECTAAVESPVTILSDADARLMVEGLALLESKVKQGKDALRAWCVTNGPVVHNGLDWGHHAQGGEGFDSAEKFYHAAKKDHVENPFQYMKVSRDACKKLRNAAGEYENHLGDVAVNARSVKFGKKKAAKAVEGMVE